jgi:hypothetical protein
MCFLGYSNLHKGFKYLDPTERHVYISRDVVFDEQVFPFSTLHPSEGARLRSELALLPDVLLNPSSSFRDIILHDRDLSSPASTDPLSSSSRCRDSTRINVEPKGEGTEKTAKKMAHRHCYLMCRSDRDSMRREVDSPTAAPLPTGTAASSSESAPKCKSLSPQSARQRQRQRQGPSASGSSTASSMAPLSPDGSTSPQPDPSEGDQH